MNYLCIDGGTTNTRVRLVRDGVITDSVSSATGSSDRDNTALKNACREMISEILARNGLAEKDISLAVASGMITSEFGLYHLPHITVPADLDKIRSCAKKVSLDICGIPFLFTPGLRHVEKGGNMMRGEELESIGLCAKYGITEPTAIILPGTHNKVILYEDGYITEINNMMSGEMFSLLVNNSILRHCFPDGLPKGFDEEALFLGAEETREFGLTEAALRIRCIANGGEKSSLWLKSYLSGAVFYCDIQAIEKKCLGRTLLLGGDRKLKEQMSSLIRRYLPQLKLIEVSDEDGAEATALGQLMAANGISL